MTYDRKKIFQKAKEVTEKHKLFFIEDIVAFLPCDKTTFYRFFEPESNEYNELKEMLETNRVSLKVSMRAKWHKSDAPALQMALMKIICTDEERKKLSMNHTDVTTDGKEINVAPPVINISIIPPIEEDDEIE
jgi:hypothetical protein